MNSNYFHFVLRIGFVFVELLMKNNLVMLGNTLLSTIYDGMIAHDFVRPDILTVFF